MKVLAINGSARSKGNTALALDTVLEEVRAGGIETETVRIGNREIRGCIGCGRCIEKQNGKCVAFDDAVNEYLPKLIEADAIVIGSPVYFSGINGPLKSFLDRAFFVARVNGDRMRLKPGAGIVALRRSGGTAAFDQLNKYFQISEMVTVGSCYWNIIHGFAPGEAEQDAEGLRIMRILGRNLVWLLRLMELGKDRVALPVQDEPAQTNFIR